MSKPFPINIESLTAEWLTCVLRAQGVLTDGAVCGFSCAPLSGGYTSSVYRIGLEYQGNAGDAPQSLVAKFHGSSSSTREMLEVLGIYEKEVRFYQFLGKDRSLPVPICYSAEFDHESGDFVLLMEDLSAARTSSAGEIIGDIRTALVHLAEIHGKFWGDPQLQQHHWIAQPSDLENPPPLKQHWADNLVQAKKRYPDQHSLYTWAVCDKWLENWDQIMLCMAHDSHTLVHTDVHLGQMFFATEKLPRFVLFDWQFPCKAWGAEDVVSLIVSELSVDDRRSHEVPLIDLYYETLCEQGVIDLSRERFWFQCKLSLLWHHYINLATVLEPAMLETLKIDSQEYGEDWREWIFTRVGSATEDWQLADILDQAIEEARG